MTLWVIAITVATLYIVYVILRLNAPIDGYNLVKEAKETNQIIRQNKSDISELARIGSIVWGSNIEKHANRIRNGNLELVTLQKLNMVEDICNGLMLQQIDQRILPEKIYLDCEEINRYYEKVLLNIDSETVKK